jgi:hypothetical protein
VKCVRCGQDDRGDRRYSIHWREPKPSQIHHECPEGHRWHVVWIEGHVHIRPCDCPSAGFVGVLGTSLLGCLPAARHWRDRRERAPSKQP